MLKKTKAKEKTTTSASEDKVDTKNLLEENRLLRTMTGLSDGEYKYRVLILLERLALANERQAKALEESLGNSEEEDEEEESENSDDEDEEEDEEDDL